MSNGNTATQFPASWVPSQKWDSGISNCNNLLYMEHVQRLFWATADGPASQRTPWTIAGTNKTSWLWYLHLTFKIFLRGPNTQIGFIWTILAYSWSISIFCWCECTFQTCLVITSEVTSQENIRYLQGSFNCINNMKWVQVHSKHVSSSILLFILRLLSW
jgi:hypothetical protein